MKIKIINWKVILCKIWKYIKIMDCNSRKDWYENIIYNHNQNNKVKGRKIKENLKICNMIIL